MYRLYLYGSLNEVFLYVERLIPEHCIVIFPSFTNVPASKVLRGSPRVRCFSFSPHFPGEQWASSYWHFQTIHVTERRNSTAGAVSERIDIKMSLSCFSISSISFATFSSPRSRTRRVLLELATLFSPSPHPLAYFYTSECLFVAFHVFSVLLRARRAILILLCNFLANYLLFERVCFK